MKEISNILKAVATSLKVMAKGIDVLAEKMNEILKDQAKKEKAPKKPASKTKSKTKPVRKAHAKKAVPKTTSESTPQGKVLKTAVGTVLEAIKDSEQGINTAVLIEKTGFDQKKIANIIFKLKKQGKITTVRKGVYKVL